jgi:hypothetical protein
MLAARSQKKQAKLELETRLVGLKRRADAAEALRRSLVVMNGLSRGYVRDENELASLEPKLGAACTAVAAAKTAAPAVGESKADFYWRQRQALDGAEGSIGQVEQSVRDLPAASY